MTACSQKLGTLTMMTIIPTHRPWLTSGRLAIAVALLAVGSSAVLMLSWGEAPAMACLASVR